MKNKEQYLQLKQVEYSDATMNDQQAIILEKASGSLVWDIEGQEYVDLCAGFGSLPLGHNHPVTQDAFLKSTGNDSELVQGLGDVYASRDKVQLLSTLQCILPSHLGRGGLTVTGSQAVELALRTACLATGGEGFICFSGAYHGLDLGLLPLVGRSDFRGTCSLLQPSYPVTRLDYACSKNQVLAAIKQLEKAKTKVAAMIVEPVLGRGGIILPPTKWLWMLHEVCQASSILLIFDEIFTGLGRTGLITHASKVPCDLLCLGKAIGGGMPLAACFGSKKVMSAWPQGRSESSYTGTFFGHPLSCRVGLATIKHIVADKLVHRSNIFGQEALEELKRLLSHFQIVKDIRGKGLMIGIEFYESGCGVTLMEKLRAKGVIAIPSGEKGQCLSITPALNIPKEILFQSFQKIAEALKEV